MEFHQKLYDLRKKSGYSQEELANKLNVSRQTVSKWELGESNPDMEKLVAISDLFEISLDELVLDKKLAEGENANTAFSEFVQEKVLTDQNKGHMKKGVKIAGIVIGILVVIDLISLIVYFVLFGVPK